MRRVVGVEGIARAVGISEGDRVLDHQHIVGAADGGYIGVINTTQRVACIVHRRGKPQSVQVVGFGAGCGAIPCHCIQVRVQFHPAGRHFAHKSRVAQGVAQHLFGKAGVLGQVGDLLHLGIGLLGGQVDGHGAGYQHQAEHHAHHQLNQ